MKMRRYILILLCCGALVAAMGCSVNETEKITVIASGDYPFYSSIDSLADRADTIIEGTILDSRIEEIDDLIISGEGDEQLNPGGEIPFSKNIYTVYTVKVNDSFKGDVEPGKTLEVKQLGGELGNVVFLSEDKVKFKEGNRYVMFLETYKDSPASLLNPIQSSYLFEVESTKESLTSVHQENNLILMMEDLQKIKDIYK